MKLKNAVGAMGKQVELLSGKVGAIAAKYSEKSHNTERLRQEVEQVVEQFLRKQRVRQSTGSSPFQLLQQPELPVEVQSRLNNMLWDKRDESQSQFNISQAGRHPKYPYHTAPKPNPNPGLPSLHEMYPFLSNPVQQTTSKPGPPPMYEPRGRSEGPKTSAYTDGVNSARVPLYAMSQGEQPDSRYQIATVKPIPDTKTNSYSWGQKIMQPVYEAVPSGQTGNSPKTVPYTDDINSMGAPLYAMPQGEQTDPRYQIATVKPITATTTNSYSREQKLLQELELLPQQQQQDVYDGAPLHLVQEGATTPSPARMPTTPLFLAYQNIRK